MAATPAGRHATVQDLARAVDEQLEVHHRTSPGVLILTELLQSMYAASMATEEGQSITFEVTWIDPDNPDPDPPERLVADRWTVVPLASRIPLTTRALVKAAKATDPRTSSFAVFASTDRQLFIWGIVDQGNRPYDFIRFDHPSAQDRPGVFQASAIGVGHLGVAIEYEPVAEFRVDRISASGLNPLSAGPVYDALERGREQHLRAVKSRVPTEIYQDREHWDATISSQWMATLTRVLLRIRGMGHGGALLITPEASAAGLDVKYEIQYPRLTAALGRLGVALILKTHADDMIWEDIANDELAVSASEHLDEAVARNEQEEAESEIDGALWFIACLSRVDGLVLMNPDLSVEGFGTIITVEAELESVFAAQDQFADPTHRVPLSPDDFGTRHRSMMRYCISYPGSVGFVISQDGDVRAMTKIADDLVVWDGVRLTRVLPSHDDTQSDVA